MSSEENKQVALSIIEALNARDLSLWSKHLAEDYKAEHPGVSVPLNKTKSVEYYQRFVTAFPDIHFEVLHVLAEGD
ncbi:MAG TPA: nuclear transport factor 2 family protein, partial [Rubrobacter sp.]|nr:nuclear transport factor 2 family protein [Rubrobacter sp.]